MGVLFLFLAGIVVMILIARLASKSRPKEERILEHHNSGRNDDKSTLRTHLEEGLASLLIKKGIITEEELESEIEIIKKIKGEL